MPSTVTALVSAYNAETFLRGCLDDLLNQTLYAQGRLEIIVVNAGSPDGTARIVREYLRQGVPLQAITSLREPLYASWNRAARLATGAYLTPANVDDRHAPDALERLADTLDSQPQVGLVYADCFVTRTPNAVWGGAYSLDTTPPYTSGRLNWPEFDPLLLTQFYFCGPQPMYRRDLHATYGLFDASYLLAGDYEWALRLAAHGVQCQRVPEVLGLFYSGGMGQANAQQSSMESRRAVFRWREHIFNLSKQPNASVDGGATPSVGTAGAPSTA